MKKVISLLLCAVMLMSAAASLCSCGDRSPVVLSYKGFRITENQFIYELAMEKTAYLTNNKLNEDKESVWTAMSEGGITVDSACMNGLLRSEILKLYFAAYAEEKGYGLTQQEEKLIDDSMAEYVGNFVDRQSFDFYMSNFSVGYDQIRDLMRLQYLSQKGQSLLFGKGQSLEISDDDALKYFNDNYATVLHVYLNNVNKTYPNQKTVPLTQEEKESKNAQIARLEKELTAENLPSYLKESDDFFRKEGAKAVTVQKGGQAKAYDSALFGATVGQVVKAECENGVYFILRQPLDASLYTEDEKKKILTLLTEQKLTEIYTAAIKDAAMDSQTLNRYSFAKAKYFTSFEPN